MRPQIDPVKLAQISSEMATRSRAAVDAKIIEQGSVKVIFSSINQLAIPANSTVSATIIADSDGDFQFSGITGSFVHAGYPATGIILVRISEQASGYSLTQGFVPFHLLVNPGFISAAVPAQRFYPTPFNETILRSTVLQFDFQNTDAAIAATVNVLAEGRKVY